MTQTFVYNSGAPKEIDGETIRLEFGLFFDGTLNNKENTDLRLKVLNQNDLKILPSDDEKEVKRKEGKLKYRRNRISESFFEFMIPYNDKKNVENKTDITDYRRADSRDCIDKQGVDNSLMNDYTNVARMWKCCNEDYAIYIEGIGSLDRQKDISAGFQFGSGDTGIRGKVRKGCKMLAEKIKSKLLFRGRTNIELTLDVFGFSRGAAAARNFLYEVNSRNKREKDFRIYPQHEKVRVSVPIAHDPYGFFAPNDMIEEERIVIKGFKDKDGVLINDKLLENGRMPKYGYLGYYLLEIGINPKILEKIDLKIRFIGLYDTVSSYEEFGNIDGIDLKIRGIEQATYYKDYFDDDVEQLQLNNLGEFEKAVHFTAMDEHRENFSLTHFSKEMLSQSNCCIEKAFPGVHCDIGGAYETESEYVDEIEIEYPYKEYPNKEYSYKKNVSDTTYLNLDSLRQYLISEYWYKEEQLEKILTEYLYFRLSGTRFLRKQYSYIPLHFMQQFFNEFLGNSYVNVISRDVVIDYPISDPQDKTLIKAKERLKKYVFRDENKKEEERSEEEKEWRFIPDEERKKLLQEEGKKVIDEFKSKRRKEQEKTKKEDQNKILLEGGAYKKIVTFDSEPQINYAKVLQEVYKRKPIFEIQDILRILRNKYLHWSANRDWFGMDPTHNRIRKEYPKKEDEK